MKSSDLTFYEFFAGGGMARAGLGKNWQCLFANDFDHKKARTYEQNWGVGSLLCEDIKRISPYDMPEYAKLIWGSFPCQDLSLAGGGAGLKGDSSGTFWPFIAHIEELRSLGRAPVMIALENVLGTLTSHKGADFKSICEALRKLGYRFGALVVDAMHFLPQSRPRLFVVAIRQNVDVTRFAAETPHQPWHTSGLVRAYDSLPSGLKDDWIWWSLPKPKTRKLNFIDVIEADPTSVKWHTQAETTALLSMMSEVNLAKVETAKLAGIPMVGGIYKRTRYEHGIKVQRAEIRFDKMSGCLRTPSGGSSRQLIMLVHGNKIKSRLISARETARLMGLDDSYQLPQAYNEAYHLTGDGVAVPVVRHLAKHIFEPVIKAHEVVNTESIMA